MSGFGRKMCRDAATLMLTARCRTPVSKELCSASDLIKGPSECPNHFDYKVLMLKRSSKSKFMPNAYVFPGGVVSGADFQKGWTDLFKDFGYNDEDLEELVLKQVDRPMMMKTNHDEYMARDIGLRLTAIRETFEESGVLLIKSPNAAHSDTFSFENSSTLSSWRKLVHTKPEQLLNLYREVGAVPDLWSVKEWSNWLTPVYAHDKCMRRFDTMFYTACLDSIPTNMMDQEEVTQVMWTDPASVLHQFYERELWLASPQVYELSRLLKFKDHEVLAEFAKERHKQGLSTWLEVMVECEDGIVSLLPGDSSYPTDPDFVGERSLNKNVFPGTLEDCLVTSEKSNRLEYKDNYNCVPKVDCDSQHGHVHPDVYQEFQKNHLNMNPKVLDCVHCPDKQSRFCNCQASSQWMFSFTNQELIKKRGDLRLEERFLQKTRDFPIFYGE